MIIGPDYVFIAVPRTASVSIASWLVAEHGGVYHGDQHGTDIPIEYREKFTFAVVRDPFTRLPSLWRYVKTIFWSNSVWLDGHEAAQWRTLGMPFDSTLENFTLWASRQSGHQWCAQVTMLKDVRIDKFPRFEDLPRYLGDLPFVRNSEDLQRVPRLNVTGPHPFLVSAECDAIAIHSAADFARFGYERFPNRRPQTERLLV